MRAIMQGLTDAEFERLYGSEDQCLAAWVKVRRDAGMVSATRAVAPPARPASLPPPSAIRVAAWAQLPWRLSAASPTLRRKRFATPTSANPADRDHRFR